MKSIFVSIASYRDPQINDTIKSLIDNKSGQYQIRLGICLQDEDEFYENFIYKNHSNIKVKFFNYKKSNGVSWARYIIQTELFDNEDYYLQIDSHSRFCKNWDSILVEELNKCENEKSLLSTYPNSFDINDIDKTYLTNKSVAHLKISQILLNKKIITVSAGIVDGETPIKGFWIAAGFIFAHKNWVNEIQYDPDFYFSGEEDYLSVKTYIEGFDIYIPTQNVIWHDYTDNRLESKLKYRPLYWEDHPGKESASIIINKLYSNNIKGKTGRTAHDFFNFAREMGKYDGIVDINIVLESESLIPSIDNKIKLIVFVLLDYNKNEIFRNDIYDESIFDKKNNFIFLKIPENINNIVSHCIWWIKYDDDTFGERLILPIHKNRNSYII
jgi:hypothetical protein